MIVLDSCLVFTYQVTVFIQFCATHILILSGFESPHTVIFYLKILTGWFCCYATRRVDSKTPAATPPPPGQRKPRPRRARRQAPPEPPRLGWPDWYYCQPVLQPQPLWSLSRWHPSTSICTNEVKPILNFISLSFFLSTIETNPIPYNSLCQILLQFP